MPPPARQLPLAGVLVVVAAGLVLASAGWWRVGSGAIGGGVLLAGLLRLALPVRQVGLLAVRSRRADVAVLLVLGAALVALASSVPAP